MWLWQPHNHPISKTNFIKDIDPLRSDKEKHAWRKTNKKVWFKNRIWDFEKKDLEMKNEK